MVKSEDILFSDISNTENILKANDFCVLKCLTEVTRESCCFLRKANEYFKKCHALCFSVNRNGISPIDRKIEDVVQLIYHLLYSCSEIHLHLFRLKTVICDLITF